MIQKSNQITRPLLCLLILFSCHKGLEAEQESGAKAPGSEPAISATHVLGFESTTKNANGSLSVQGDALRFQKGDNSTAQIPLESIRKLSLGEQDKQVGGVPMVLARAATPFEGGRVIGLFSHKKYDTVTLEYLDATGGLHGAVFLLRKGQGQVLRDEVDARRPAGSSVENNSSSGSAEEGK